MALTRGKKKKTKNIWSKRIFEVREHLRRGSGCGATRVFYGFTVWNRVRGGVGEYAVNPGFDETEITVYEANDTTTVDDDN
jgi:hypothetical protein